jgi:hypothetical protein
MIAKLSKRAIDASLPVKRPTVIYDTDLKGFGVRLAPSGALSWFIEYRPGAGGRRVAKKRYGLGGRELTPEEARTLAKQTLASIALGNDPSATRQTQRQMPTLREFGEEYLEDEAEAKLKLRTVANYRIYLRKHVFPALGSSKINVITRGDIARLHTSIGHVFGGMRLIVTNDCQKNQGNCSSGIDAIAAVKPSVGSRRHHSAHVASNEATTFHNSIFADKTHYLADAALFQKACCTG